MSRTFDTLTAGAGFILWSLCFIALYGLFSIACMLPTLGLPVMRPQSVTIMLVGVWGLFLAAHVGAIVVNMRRCRVAGEERAFVLRIGVYLNLTAIAATLVIGAPVLGLPACR